MLPFTVTLRSGVPLYEQLVYAVRRVVAGGQLRPGDAFPSVRTLSQELRINPNTAHRIVAALVDEGLLVVKPGIGTIVAAGGPAPAAAKRAILETDVEKLAVDAVRAGLSLQDVVTALKRQWARLIARTG